MTKRQLVCVHGHTIKELERLLQDACALFDESVTLEINALGGWSNINIRGYSGEIDFVLKLPWTISSHSIEPYKKLFDISLFFNRHELGPLPLSIGKLSDSKETPFIIFEYVAGVIHSSLTDFSVDELAAVNKCLHHFSQQKPPGLTLYESASDYIATAHDQVDNHEGLSSCSQELADLHNSLSKLYPEVLSYADSLGKWTQSLMHGDLWVPNIVLQSDKVILLDFEAAAYGHRLYDMAYLLETPSIPETKTFGLISPDEIDRVNKLRPIALAYVVEWSLERLLSVESNLVEPNLATKESWSAVMGYTRSKISRLEALLTN